MAEIDYTKIATLKDKQRNIPRMLVNIASLWIPLLMWSTLIVHKFILELEIITHICILLILVILTLIPYALHWFMFVKELRKTYESVDDFVEQQNKYDIKVSKRIKATLENSYWKFRLWTGNFSRTPYFLSFVANFETYKLSCLQRQQNYFLVVNYENFFTMWAVIFVRFIIQL